MVMTQPLRAGVIGVGLVGSAHIEAIARTGFAEVGAVAASSPESAQSAAGRFGVPTVHPDWRALLADPTIDVVHNCTPNHLHGVIGQAALAAGKHLISEKPLAATVSEAFDLVLASEQSSLVTALCHNYRHYPMVARARELIRGGAIGEVYHVHGVYLQDWLCAADASDWRLMPGEGGASITFADIGTHWCDLAMYLIGRRIESVCAATAGRHDRLGDDHGGVLLSFEGGPLGSLVASQVSPGARNSLRIQLDGSEGSLAWDQERPEDLWLGRASGPAELYRKSPDELGSCSRPLARLPSGHIEGWGSTFANLFRSVYRRILDVPEPGDDSVATLAEGLVLMRLIEGVGRSNSERSWVTLPVPALRDA
jgi:predicted dehydrogenase